MDVKPYEKMIELVQRAEEKGVTLVLTFQSKLDEDQSFAAVATNATDAELVKALTTKLEELEEEE